MVLLQGANGEVLFSVGFSLATWRICLDRCSVLLSELLKILRSRAYTRNASLLELKRGALHV